LCDRCALPLAGETCRACERHAPRFVRAVAAGAYTGVVREAVHALKYRGQRAAAHPLAERVASSPHFPAGDWLVVPVPLTAKRKRERGFNQAALLGRAIARLRKLPYADALARTVETTPQHGLSREARQHNLAGAFACRKPVAGRRVLLVDDVLTTGATVDAAADVLLAAGAVEVAIAIVGRTLAPGQDYAPSA
jgi:ComF family protein